MSLPFFYGWVVVAAGFVTMAIGVNARTAFSLLFPPILEEFGWERGLTAGAFSFGFLVSAFLSPLVGRLMDRRGPRVVIEIGVFVMAAGLMLAPFVSRPWHLYATLGVLVGGGGNCLGYTGQSLYLPNWFVRRRGLALSDPAVGALHVDPLLALELDAGLDALAREDARAAQVVELHYFAGLPLERVAELLGAIARTAHRDWRWARAFLADHAQH